jgi:hypothetical protein
MTPDELCDVIASVAYTTHSTTAPSGASFFGPTSCPARMRSSTSLRSARGGRVARIWWNRYRR